MKRDEACPSIYWRAIELQEQERTLTIKSVMQETLPFGGEQRLAAVAAFEETDKKLINKRHQLAGAGSRLR